MNKYIFGFALLLTATNSIAGPFGIEMGDVPSMSKFKDFQEVNGRPNMLLGQNPPKAHSSFENYGIKFSSSSGACWVKGIGKDIEPDAYGTSTKSEMDKVAKQISSKYGKSEKTDMLGYESIWDEADEWLIGLTKNERFYMYQWNSDSGANLEGTGIESMALIAQASDRTTGYIAVEFSFDNKKTCDEEETQQGEDAF